MVRIISALIFISLFSAACRQSKDSLYKDEIRSAMRLDDNGKFKDAMVKIDDALEIDSDGIAALYQKGLTFILEKKFDSAIVFCNKAICEKGADTLYLDLNQNNPVDKEVAFEDVEMASIRYCRGFSFYMLNNYAKALSDFEFCLVNGFNNNGSVFLYAGLIYSSKGYSEKACNYFDLALKNGNSEAQSFLLKSCK